MRTPVSAIHLYALGAKTLGEAIETAYFFASGNKVDNRSGDQHCCHDSNGSPGQFFGLLLAFPLLLTFSALFRHGILYHDVQRSAQNVELLTMQSEGFTIDHNVNGLLQIEVDLLHPPPLGQGMVDVRSVIKGRQIPHQADASDRPPAHEFDQAIIHFGLGCDHHGASRELAVAEGKKQAWTAVDLTFSINF